MKLEDIDLTDEDTWADHIPHDQFSFLRAEAPIYRHPGNTVGDRVIEDFWALTRHADVQVVNRDTTTFSSEQRGVMVSEPDEETSAHFRTMLDTDPPAHTRLRRLVNRGFTPRMVTRFEEHYAQLTSDLLAKAVAQGTFDFVTDVAAELPLMAIAEILGVPVEDRHKLFEWSNKLVGNSDPEYVGSADDALTAATELYVYFNQLGEERRAVPGDDIISRLITELEGDALGPHEFETFCLLLTVAGNETTRNATSHGMHALLEHPDQMQLLRHNPELLDPA
ncbi:MAG: cytochrome P450, partial [Acidimicrobiales bacterium]